MKIFIVLSAVLACAVAANQYGAPAPVVKAMAQLVSSYGSSELKKPIIPITKLDVQNDNQGSYSVDAISGDGSKQSESAVLKNLGDEEGSVSVSKGSYSFTSDDGKLYTVNWTADENGFQAQGEHLPTSPPVPAEILKSLEDNKYSSSEKSYSAPAPLPSIRSSKY